MNKIWQHGKPVKSEMNDTEREAREAWEVAKPAIEAFLVVPTADEMELAELGFNKGYNAALSARPVGRDAMVPTVIKLWPHDPECADPTEADLALHYGIAHDSAVCACKCHELLEGLAHQPPADRVLDEVAEPVDMLIFCPVCGKQHVDKPEPDRCTSCGRTSIEHLGAVNVFQDSVECKKYETWNNPPHKSHTCRTDYGGCGNIFRIADFPTNGVEAIKTVGKDDTWKLEAQTNGDQ